ncbi:hypothetical protein KY284_029990 [Solanum tuberosum]|nr:hypothetical protein KY284_029990 [Solanum tuberosum]
MGESIRENLEQRESTTRKLKSVGNSVEDAGKCSKFEIKHMDRLIIKRRVDIQQESRWKTGHNRITPVCGTNAVAGTQI